VILTGWAVFASLVVYTLVIFGFTPERIYYGLGKLGFVLSFMFPPAIFDTWELWKEPCGP
jgi:phosphonate transport system permease protein